MWLPVIAPLPRRRTGVVRVGDAGRYRSVVSVNTADRRLADMPASARTCSTTARRSASASPAKALAIAAVSHGFAWLLLTLLLTAESAGS